MDIAITLFENVSVLLSLHLFEIGAGEMNLGSGKLINYYTVFLIFSLPALVVKRFRESFRSSF